MRDYWFAEQDGKDVVKKLAQSNDTRTAWSSSPLIQAWVRNSIAYYSCVLEPAFWDTSLIFTGEQGELVRMLIPQARSLLRQLVSIICKQKLAFNGIAISDGNDVIQVTRLANALSQQVVLHQDLDLKYEYAVEQALLLGAGFLKTTWRTDKGKPYAQDGDGNLVFEGDVEIASPTVWDITRDYSIINWPDLDWVQCRTMKNRWSLVAQFPELATAIRALPSVNEWRGPFRANYQNVSEEDYVYTYEVFHRPGPALPNGRMLFYSDVNTLYFDGPNYYDCIPIEEMKPEPIAGCGFGYPAFSNILPAQEMLDTVFSANATNLASFGVQNVVVPRGAGISAQDILGMNFMSYTPMPGVPGGGKPEPLQLAQNAGDSYKFIDMLKANMQELSAVNSALRGEPPPQVSSGTAIATLTSTALESINASAKSGRLMLKKTMMHAINAYRKFASTPHMVRMVGRNYESFEKPFVGKDLDPIQNMELTEANPLMQTLSGRLEISDKLLQTGLIKNMQAYFSILEGNPPKDLYKTELSQEDLVNRENDNLMDGEPVIVMNTDNHPLHIYEHAGLLNDPKVRFNSDKVQAIQEHILSHYDQSKSVDPFFAAMVATGKMPEGGPPPPTAPAQSIGPGGGPQVPGNVEDNLPTAQPANPAKDLVGRTA